MHGHRHDLMQLLESIMHLRRHECGHNGYILRANEHWLRAWMGTHVWIEVFEGIEEMKACVEGLCSSNSSPWTVYTVSMCIRHTQVLTNRADCPAFQ